MNGHGRILSALILEHTLSLFHDILIGLLGPRVVGKLIPTSS